MDRAVSERGRMEPDRVSVLVASPLEPEHAARIEAADPRVSVLYLSLIHI